MPDEYFCGPQSWPKWIRKPLSKYYNRSCRQHDSDYGDPEVSMKEAEQKFHEGIEKKRIGVKRARRARKISLFDYVFYGLILGYLMSLLTKKFGSNYKVKK